MAKSQSNSQVVGLDEAEVDTAAPQGAAAPVADVVKVAAPDAALSGKKITLTIHPTEGDGGSDAVDVQINGYLYRIPRGVPCEVPEEVYFIVRDAKMETFQSGQGGAQTARTVQRFAFSAIG